MTSAMALTLGLLSLMGHLAWAKIVLPDVFDQEDSNDLYEYEDFANSHKRSDTLIEEQDPADTFPFKRMDSNQFFHMRGRRNGGESTLVDEHDPETLLKLAHYFRYLQAKRSLREDTPSSSSLSAKRQPPQGFHAVRGKRSFHH